MTRLPLAVLLAALALAALAPAGALAECGGATRFRATTDICPPTAHFEADATTVAPGTTVTFDATRSSVLEPRTIVSYAWDFDSDDDYDETHGPGEVTASHTFTERGTKTVTLLVTDSSGMVGTHAVTIVVTNPPTAALQASDPSPLSLTDVTLDASGSSDALDGEAIAGFEWDLDGDGEHDDADTGAATTTASWPTPGAREVGVRVTDADGATATATVTVSVRNRLPTPAVTLPLMVLAGKPASLSAQPSSDLDGEVVAYRWDLDGLPGFELDRGADPALARTWNAPGSYSVGLEVEDDAGDTATTTVTVVVKSPPSAVLGAAAQEVAPGATVSLSAAGSSDADGTIALYAWDLDGDGVFERATGTTPAATTSFAEPGTATLRVRVIDDDGLTSIAATTITVKAPAGGTPEDSPGSGDSDGDGSGTDDSDGDTTAPPPGSTDDDDGDTSGDDDDAPPTADRAGGTAGAGTASPAAAIGTPRATAPGANAATAPALDSSPVQRLRAVLRGGLRIACRADAGTRCAVRIEVDRRTAKRLRLGRATSLGSATLTASASGATVVRLSARARRALARVRSVRLLVRGTATAADGTTTPVTRVVLARR